MNMLSINLTNFPTSFSILGDIRGTCHGKAKKIAEEVP